jgi:hypothetical protein
MADDGGLDGGQAEAAGDDEEGGEEEFYVLLEIEGVNDAAVLMSESTDYELVVRAPTVILLTCQTHSALLIAPHVGP